MLNPPRIIVAFLRVTLAFSVAALVWWLLVAVVGTDAGSAALVGLAAILAFAAGVSPGVACVESGRTRAAFLWFAPVAALIGAFIGLQAFHFLLQLLVASMPALSPAASVKAEAAGSVVVWAVLSVSVLLVALASHAPRFLRVVMVLAVAGFAAGLAMWIRALGI